jgi:hypothetical protein
VRPVLAESCFTCHGFDPNKRQAGLRLDTPQGAYGKLASGRQAVVPGNLKASEMVERITAAGPMHMPPEGSGKKISPAQIDTLKRWIAQGAKYDPHWAFVAPKRPPLPQVKMPGWCRNPIDRFILAKLDKEGLSPSPQADRRTLIRRVSLDLTGLPPTPAEVHAFLADTKPLAYERLVDRLLASPHYGERMAVQWLDCARYADTHGFHIDSGRDMWRWRDWVIDAYNGNLPYDQFVIRQLAGDLLPNATLDERIASGFNRNHPINFEGGAIPQEYQTAYIVDRIDTTATTFMGLTMRCAQCHSHKYDPITQREYYRFYAFFNNIQESGLDGQKGNAAPFLKAPSRQQAAQLAAHDAQLSTLRAAVAVRMAEAAPAVGEWERKSAAGIAQSPLNLPDTPSSPAGQGVRGLLAHYRLDEGAGIHVRDAAGKQPAGSFRGLPAWAPGPFGPAIALTGQNYVEIGPAPDLDRADSFSYGAWIYPTSNEAGAVLSRMDDAAANHGWDIYLTSGRVYAHLIHAWESNAVRVNTKNPVPLNRWSHVFVTYDGSSKAHGVRIYVDGRPQELDYTHDSLTDTIRSTAPFTIGRRTPGSPFQGRIADVRVYARQLSEAEVADLARLGAVERALAVPAAKRTAEQRDAITRAYLERTDATFRKLAADLAGCQSKRDALDGEIPTTMVMQEREKPRDTFMLIRGQYDKPGDKVTPGTPDCLPPLPEGARTGGGAAAPPNRLTLARWLVSPTHPLTARVAVNRLWQMVFGTGIVKTVEDFGTQGERPSHRELLDWLATEFVRTGWDQKRMMRLLVTSAAYRQSSAASPALRERDPENRLLARGPRQRLQAEFIRDQALELAGLLNPEIGGKSIKIYQPPGLWEEMAFGGGFSEQTYAQDHGDKLYRRGMYIFAKRTVPPPSLETFDAPSREFCYPRRSVTNTPLQALELMNDPEYVEAARKFAERILTSGRSDASRIDFAYLCALARPARPAERRILLHLLHEEQAAFRKDPVKADMLLSVGDSDRNFGLNMEQLAAYATVASVILNLDEVITKE